MNRDAMKQLHLDRRLINRKGWITQADLERELAELPDVSHKVAPPEEEPEASAASETAADG